MKDRFLPIGTVVLLKNSKEPLMINGYCVYEKGVKESIMYDYGSCKFPIGVIDGNVSIAFNKEKIDKIIHMGYEDDTYKEFEKVLSENIDKIRDSINS